MNIFPKVVEQNKLIQYTLGLKSLDNIESIIVSSKNDFFHNEQIDYKIVEGKIVFEYKMKILGEFFVRVNFSYKESKFEELYCVDSDTIDLIPLKGDLHMHSIYSDGKRTPFAMVLASLEAGMDFMAITDHDNYEGSQIAIKKVKQNNIDIIVLSGEEVSVGKGDTSKSRGNGHILSINANRSIDDQRKDDKVYEKELEDISNSLKDIEKSIDPLHYARNIWAVQKIKDANGLAILCHPNWIYYDHKYHLHQAIYKKMLKDSKIDGVEVIGDIDKIEECNNMAYLTYMQNENRYKYLSPISNTDAHDSDHDLGMRFTVVLSRYKNTKSVVEAIENGLTCAVLKREEEHQFIAKDDLAHYIYFLIKEYFPKHQKLRNRLAKLYMDQLINGQGFEQKVESTKNRLDSYNKQFFGKRDSFES